MINCDHSMLCSAHTSLNNIPPPPYTCATCPCVSALSAMLLMLLSASTRLLLLLAQCALTRIS